MPRKLINEFLVKFSEQTRDFDPKLLPARKEIDGFLECPFFGACQIDFLLCLDHMFRHFKAFLEQSEFSEKEKVIIQNCYKLCHGDVLTFLLSIPPEISNRLIRSVRRYPYL